MRLQANINIKNDYKMKNYTFLLLFSIMFLFFSCADKVAFTYDLKKEYGLREKALQKIQFYTSSEIVLLQSGNNSILKTQKGEILINATRNTNRIMIKKNTPCTIEKTLDTLDSRVVVSFEVGENKTLLFGVNQSNGYYSLLAKGWRGNVGTVEYENSTYETVSGGAAILLVKLKKLNQSNGKERTLSGKRL